ncbi:LysR family transcriptional regulator [Octadecabacter sp.]|nr:LysR family transcriptional regulator [Octadecabacter sp.]
MDKKITPADWSLVQAFLAVAEEGSLSAAARALRASQPTLGRQIRTLEQQLQAELFTRQPRGLVLTETGAALMTPARAMRDAMHEISLAAAGRSVQIEGTVRITASTMTALYHLPKIIAEIRRLEPAISIELVPSDASSNLLYREADIALRMYRPTQLDLVTQHLGDVKLVLCASRSYLEKAGPLTGPQDFKHHDFVGFDTSTAIIDGLKKAGIDVTRDFFKTRCDDHSTFLALIRSGCGVGFSQGNIVAGDPELVAIETGFPIPGLPIWLTAHEAMRETPRIRRVWDLLAKGLKPLVS